MFSFYFKVKSSSSTNPIFNLTLSQIKLIDEIKYINYNPLILINTKVLIL